MSSITTDLAATLNTVRRRGDFFVSGTTELLAPLLEVDGVGPIALPLLPIQAEQLVAVAQRAPYGRGEETLVDTAVGRTWGTWLPSGQPIPGTRGGTKRRARLPACGSC